MTEVRISRLLRFGHEVPHLDAIVAMKRVALDDRGGQAFAPKDLLERRLHRRRAGSRRAGDRENGMLGRHAVPPKV
jgi:hypothetical protein